MASAGPTAFFVAIPVDPDTYYGPPGAIEPLYSYRGAGSMICGYVVESDRVRTPEEAAHAFREHVLADPAIRLEGGLAHDCTVGTICDTTKVRVGDPKVRVGDPIVRRA